MKGLLLLAPYFEDTEALTTLDILRRAALKVDLVSITTLKLITQSNVIIYADKLIDDINLNDYDFLIIPGGKAVMLTHLKSDITKKVIEHFNYKKQLIACICAAPSILGVMGLLDNEQYTCFPGFETYMHGTYLENKKVVVSNNYITSKAMGTSFEFGYEIIKYLCGEELAKKTINSCYYEMK